MSAGVLLLCGLLAITAGFEVPETMNFTEKMQFLKAQEHDLRGAVYDYDSTTGFTLVVTSNVKKGDCVLTANPRTALTVADEYPLKQYVANFTEYEQLAIRVAYEKAMPRNPEDFKREYVHFLPTSGYELPLNWTEEDFKLLEAHTLDYYPRQNLQFYDTEEFHKKVKSALKDAPGLPSDFPQSNYLAFGLAVVLSRSFASEGGHVTKALGLGTEKRPYYYLFPLLDIPNHFPVHPSKRSADATVFRVMSHLDNWVCYRAQIPQTPGQYFVGSYRLKSNVNLLRWYGFALEYNPDDDISLHLPETEYCTGAKRDGECVYGTTAHALSVSALRDLASNTASYHIRGDLTLDQFLQHIDSSHGVKKQKLLYSLLKYRKVVKGQMNRSPLRTDRANREKCQTQRCRLIYTYVIGQRVSRHLHMRQIDKKLLQLASVGII